jgi:hypothetical protein
LAGEEGAWLQLPDGRAADGVYLILNDPYREVMNNALVRPLNYAEATDAA